MNKENVLEILGKNADSAFRENFVRNYPAEARPVIGINYNNVNELARMLSHEDNWKNLSDQLINGKTYEEFLLGVAILDNADIKAQEYFERITSLIPKIDSVKLCDAVCLSIRLGKEEPELMLDFLKPRLFSDNDMEQRFAIVMLLDYFVNTDYIDATLALFASVEVRGPLAKDALQWGYQVCFIAYPQKTFAVLDNLKIDHELMDSILDRIEDSKRLFPSDRLALQALRAHQNGEDNEA